MVVHQRWYVVYNGNGSHVFFSVDFLLFYSVVVCAVCKHYEGTFPTDAGHVYIARHVAASILGIELHQHNTHKHKVKGTNTTKVKDEVKPSDKTKFFRF